MSASHSRAADLTRESSTACKSKEERLRTFRTSAVAALRWRVWRNSRVRLATSRFEATSHAMCTTLTKMTMAARTINQVAMYMGSLPEWRCTQTRLIAITCAVAGTFIDDANEICGFPHFNPCGPSVDGHARAAPILGCLAWACVGKALALRLLRSRKLRRPASLPLGGAKICGGGR